MFTSSGTKAKRCKTVIRQRPKATLEDAMLNLPAKDKVVYLSGTWKFHSKRFDKAMTLQSCPCLKHLRPIHTPRVYARKEVQHIGLPSRYIL